MSRLDPKLSTIKILYCLAAGCCCICKNGLTKEKIEGGHFNVGEIAHICAAEVGGPRYNASLDDEAVRGYDNLMLLCPSHHTEIDGDTARYPVEALKTIKGDHERWAREQLAIAMPSVAYPDLEVIIKYLQTSEASETPEDYSLTEIKEKIHKNELTPATERLIQMGLTQASTISGYLNDFPDPAYEDRLKQIFIAKYVALRSQDAKGDTLFFSLVEEVRGASPDISRYAAAIALVTYFFERCDIFEK